MAETKAKQQEVSEIGTRGANIEPMVRLSLVLNPQTLAFAQQHFRAKKNSAEVYLALEEPKSQEQLRKLTGLKAASISTICTHLEEQGFVSRVRNPANKKEWLFKRNEVERTLGLSKIARATIKR